SPPSRSPPSLPASFASVNPSTTFASRTVAQPAAQLSQVPDSQRGSQLPPPSALAPPMLALDDDAPTSANPAPSSTSRASLRPPPAGALRKPAIEIPNVEWLPPKEPEKRPLRIGRFFAVLLVLGVIVLFAFLPVLARGFIVSSAAERGITLEVGRVELSRRA